MQSISHTNRLYEKYNHRRDIDSRQARHKLSSLQLELELELELENIQSESKTVVT